MKEKKHFPGNSWELITIIIYFLHSKPIPWLSTKRTAATVWKELNGQCFPLLISIHANRHKSVVLYEKVPFNHH